MTRLDNIAPIAQVTWGVLQQNRLHVLDHHGELQIHNARSGAAYLREHPIAAVNLQRMTNWAACSLHPASLEILELFAFAFPARSVSASARGIIDALGDASNEYGPAQLLYACERMIEQIGEEDQRTVSTITHLQHLGWGWAGVILTKLPPLKEHPPPPTMALEIWRGLPRWQDRGPRMPADDHALTQDEAIHALQSWLQTPPRPGQCEYSASIASALQPRRQAEAPAIVISEAGTGTGKTIGYLAPILAWTAKTGACLWVSTFSRALQQQLEREIINAHGRIDHDRIVIRKGRENYLCLLNMEERILQSSTSLPHFLYLLLIARWARATRDGDITGTDFPAWMSDLAPKGFLDSIRDRRAECIHAHCRHYEQCFVEHNHRRARHAELVIANHALVMGLATQQRLHAEGSHYFLMDEAHHVFACADQAYACRICGRELAELRQWLLGHPNNRRARGFWRRIAQYDDVEHNLQSLWVAVQNHATALSQDDWLSRIRNRTPTGPCERFLACLRDHIHARSKSVQYYPREALLHDPSKA
ncbi:MAG: hypothetical protein AAF352_03245, partial [Pseudomonadota bacterium]